ncbi:MAG: DegT/DnrJ/EryC1/StrS family aminotransferase [Vicinamibacterales bacterium]
MTVRTGALAGRTVPFHAPSIGEAEIAAVVDVLRSGWLTTGPRAKEFERAFAAAVGAPHAVALNSATAALHLALEAAGVGPGDEVVVPTMTFAATAEVVLYLGARPVLADCDEATLNLAPGEIDRLLTPRTRAVIPVHYAGRPCDMDDITARSRAHGLTVIEDAAHCFPCTYRGRPIGAISDFTCFSFYATKTITTGEGGMVTTADEDAATRMRLMSLHGISGDAWKRYTSEGSWFYEVVAPGMKYNLTDIAAALGLVQLGRAEEFRRERTRIASRYSAAFETLSEVRCPEPAGDGEHAWHLYPIRLRLDRLRIGRGPFTAALKAANVGCSVHFIPLHVHPYYRDAHGYRSDQFPNASAAYEELVSLPIYPAMTDADVDYVVEAVRSVVAAHRR